MEKKQTAVEWLMENLHNQSNAFEKAKEMEIQQTIDFVDWLTRKDSPYSIMYGGEPERLSTLDEDFTIKEVYETYKNKDLKQAAVEWLMNELTKNGSGAVKTFGDLFEQAKEMERKQKEEIIKSIRSYGK